MREFFLPAAAKCLLKIYMNVTKDGILSLFLFFFYLLFHLFIYLFIYILKVLMNTSPDFMILI